MEIKAIKEVLPRPVSLDDGLYQGIWGGYVIKLTHNKRNFELTTARGVRGFNIPVVVTIKDGEGTFRELNN